MKTEHLLILAVVILLLAKSAQADTAEKSQDPYNYTFP